MIFPGMNFKKRHLLSGVIASEAKQFRSSSFVDCFVASLLAMTGIR